MKTIYTNDYALFDEDMLQTEAHTDFGPWFGTFAVVTTTDDTDVGRFMANGSYAAIDDDPTDWTLSERQYDRARLLDGPVLRNKVRLTFNLYKYDILTDNDVIITVWAKSAAEAVTLANKHGDQAVAESIRSTTILINRYQEAA